MKIFQLVSFWALVAGGALYLAQIPPIPGVILMMFGAPFFARLLFHVALIALFVEALTQRIPRWLALVPVMAYGGYYVAYLQEGSALKVREAEILAAAPKVPFVYDPARYSFVDKAGFDFAERYNIPSVYTQDESWPYAAYVHLLAPISQCDFQGEYRLGVMTQDMRANQFDACRVSYRKAIPHPVVQLIHHPIDYSSNRDQLDVAEVLVQGQVRVRYTALVTSRLPRVPLLIAGCFLIDSASQWRCTFDFARKRLVFGSYLGAFGSKRPLAALIGLREYSLAEVRHFPGYAENTPLIDVARQAIRTNTPIPFQKPSKIPAIPTDILRVDCADADPQQEQERLCRPAPPHTPSCTEIPDAITIIQKERSALMMESSRSSGARAQQLRVKADAVQQQLEAYNSMQDDERCPALPFQIVATDYLNVALRCLNYQHKGDGGDGTKTDCDRRTWRRDR